MKFIELCAGAGGMHLGLELAGWSGVEAVELDESAALIHRSVFGHCSVTDVFDIDPESLPSHDVLVAGFPCQPFSSSGHRTGFSHHSGTVFERIIEIVGAIKPKALLLENVKGLLSNQAGYTMARVLQALTNHGYRVSWAIINAWWLGVPQNRPRVTIFAVPNDRPPIGVDLFGQPQYIELLKNDALLAALSRDLGINAKFLGGGSLQKEVSDREPTVGKPARAGGFPFGMAGVAMGDNFASLEIQEPIQKEFDLGANPCPGFWKKDEVKSVRYWGHSGKTRPYMNDGSMAHCIGTTIGASPMFAVPEQSIRTRKDEFALLEYANWSRSEHGLRIFRLTPERGALLFGKEIAPIATAAKESGISQTKMYEIMGNMVVPAVAKFCGDVLRKALSNPLEVF